jgi:hypothetical protein
MAFRGAEETLRARILELEQENAELRAELERLGGKKPISHPPPPPLHGGDSIWSPGDSWLMGWDPASSLLSYTGESDNQQYLRFLDVSKNTPVSFALAANGAKHTARLATAIAAPLQDGSLAFFTWPGNTITHRIRLNAPLIAPPIQSDSGDILCVTASRELLVIDAGTLVVGERKQVDAASLEALGFPSGDARQHHNGYAREISLRDGWKLDAWRDVDELTLCALSRKFAGNEEMGACVVRKRGDEPLWLREAGGGTFIYLYGIDRMLVVHNVSLEVPAKTWAFWQKTGEPVFTISGRGEEAVLEIYDTDGGVLARSSV